VILIIAAAVYFWRSWKKIERVQPVAVPTMAESPSSPDAAEPLVEAAAITVVEEPLPANPEPTPSPTATPQLAQPYRYPAAAPSPTATPTMILPPFEPAPRLPRPQ
jgi:hypothetical protein